MRRGFSLLETISSIGVVAVMMAVVAPVMMRARDNGFRGAALVQAKQLGVALLAYSEDHSAGMPLSTNYVAADDDPNRIWTGQLAEYAKDPRIFVAPGSGGEPAKGWSSRGAQTIGLNSSLAFDPEQGCTGKEPDTTGCHAFRTALRFAEAEGPATIGLFAVTPGGDVKDGYAGYEFSPYNGLPHDEKLRLSPPLVADRDLVNELREDLPGELIKPVFARYLATGEDEGVTPVVFADGHAKSFSAAAIGGGNTGIAWRLR